MDPITIFEKLALPAAIIVILLIGISGLFFLLWRSSEQQKEELRRDLKEARAKAEENNALFIASLKDQNINTKTIADALLPVRVSTDQIPNIVSGQRETLSSIAHVVDLVRERDTQTRRRGDPNK